jgi:phosphatidylglycerophosphate synthase
MIAASKLGKWKMTTQVIGISLMILGAKLDDIGLWRRTGRAALYVMTAMALISGVDYFRRFLKPILARESGEYPVVTPVASVPSPKTTDAKAK